MLANSVGVIDQGYVGEIFVPLIKLDDEADDLKLPCRVVQLIPRRWYSMVPTEIEHVPNTSRGSNGFGSTGH
jgi:dUTP pyrophosphatase